MSDISKSVISRSWRIEKQHKGFFTGGRIHPLEHNGILYIVCWNAEDISIIRVDNGECVCHIDSEEDGFLSFAVHPSDLVIITSSRSGLVKRWTLNEEESGFEAVLSKSWRGHELPVLDMCFDFSGTYIATASNDRTVRVWNAEKGFCTHNFKGHKDMVLRVFFHPELPLRLVSSSEGGELRIWDLETKSSRILDNHMSAVLGFAFGPASNRMVSGGRDKVLSIWDASSYDLIQTIPVYEYIEALVSLDDRYFASAGASGNIKIWDWNTLKKVDSFDIEAVADHHKSSGSSEDISPEDVMATTITNMLYLQVDGAEQLITTTGEHNICIYDKSNKSTKDSEIPFAFDNPRLLVGYNDEVTDCASLHDGKHFAISTNSANVRIFSQENFNASELVGHRDIVLSVDVSADGRYVITGAKDNSIRIWKVTLDSDVCRAICIAECTGHAESVGAVRFSPLNCSNTLSFFAVSASRDRTLKVWDCRSLLKSDAHMEELEKGPGILCKTTKMAHEKDINSIDISPNGKLIASGSQDRTIKIWNSDDLSLVGTLKGHRRGVWRVRFSPVDKVIASCSGDKTIKLWSLQDLTCLRTLEGHMDSVVNFVFLNNGMQIMSSGADGVLKLWVVKTQECVGSFSDGHTDKVWAMCATKQNTIVTGGIDSVINVWEDVTEKELIEEKEEKEDRARKQQDLENLLVADEYAKVSLLLLLWKRM